MRKRLFLLAGLAALAFVSFVSLAHTAPPTAAKWYTLANTADVGGLWVQRDGAKPFAAVYAQRFGGRDVAVLGVSRDGTKGDGHDFAIIAEADGVRLQILDADGKPHSIPATALLKLAEAEPKPAQAANQAEGRERRLNFNGLRGRIRAELDRRAALDPSDPDHIDQVKHAKAKELVGELGDGHLLELLIKYGPQIIALVKAILAMLAFL